MVGVGSTLGNYQVVEKIGQGAMGAVYLAVHPIIGKRVALKVIHSSLATDEEMVSRFFNEARAVTQIGHPNIVDVQDFGQTPTGESFIVMELLEGIGLGALLRRDGPLAIERAVKIAAQITDGLMAAHARGIIHRDLKPDNLFLVKRGNDPDFVKILDFGLAKLTGPGAMAHRTRTGAVLGTAHYMSPEAAESSRSVDHRSDVYALGCILFQLLTGRVPFPGDGFGEVLVRQLREPPPLPSRLRPEIAGALEKIILHALAKKPDFRFSSMDDFGRALRDPARFEAAFDEQGVTSAELAATAMKREPVVAAAPQVAPVRASQIASDAKTISGDAAQRDHDGTSKLDNPLGATTVPSATRISERDDRSIARKRARAAFGFGASIMASVAILGVAGGIAYHLLYGEVVVSVTSSPTGAEVVLGANNVGTTPVEVKLARSHGAIVLLLQKPGYVTARRPIEPRKDITLDVTLELQPKPPVEPESSPAPEPVAQVELPQLAPPTAEPEPKRARVKRKPSGPAPFKKEGQLLAPTF